MFPNRHPFDWVIHLFIGWSVFWFSHRVLGLDKRASVWTSLFTLVTIEATQFESGVYRDSSGRYDQPWDHVLDVGFGAMGICVAVDLHGK